MKRVTLDTNVLPPKRLLEAASGLGYEFAIVTVTSREIVGTDLNVTLQTIPESAVWDESVSGQATWGAPIPEVFVLGESRLGEGVLGNKKHADLFEESLQIISNGSFPKTGSRSQVTHKQRNQLRDAMILTAHLRDARDIFVTNDTTGFIKHGRRKTIEEKFRTKIMTENEFVDFCEIQKWPTSTT